MDYNECGFALQCEKYNAKDPCEKPIYKFMRKPKCFTPNKESLAGKIMKAIMRFGGATSSGTLEDIN